MFYSNYGYLVSFLKYSLLKNTATLKSQSIEPIKVIERGTIR